MEAVATRAICPACRELKTIDEYFNPFSGCVYSLCKSCRVQNEAIRTREIIEVMAVNESKRSEVKCDPSLAVPQARWVVCQPTKSSGKGIIRVARLVYHLSYELS